MQSRNKQAPVKGNASGNVFANLAAVILQTEWFAKNLVVVIPAKAGIHTTHS